MRGLYLVTDRSLCGGRSLEEVVIQAVKGGASFVQLREKEISTRFFVEEAGRIKKYLEPYKVPLIIIDRVDVAVACGAEGVHIGQEDLSYEIVRKLMGEKAIMACQWKHGTMLWQVKNSMSIISASARFLPRQPKPIQKALGVWKVLPELKLSAGIHW
jgi:thiamine-phosphate diphosphorylase